MKKSITVRFQMDGMHKWPEAAGDVAFLKNPHRHKFFFEATADVTHNNRQIEFFTLKDKLEIILLDNFETCFSDCFDFGTLSCEGIAEKMLDKVPELTKVSVWEDNENGATVER